MSTNETSNNSTFPTPNRPLTARDILRDLITRNLEIIQTRTSCLMARSMVAYNTSRTQTDKSMLDALSDLITAPFLRLGKQYRESPITQEIVAASRKFNNLLVAAKREATLHIRGIAKLDVFDPASQRKIERLGLRFPIIKLDIEELIAADEADADADANANAEANAVTHTDADADANADAPVLTHPADVLIAAEIAKLNAPAAVPSNAPTPTPTSTPTPIPTPTPTPTPPRGKPFSLPTHPNNKKRNRFKKRRAA